MELYLKKSEVEITSKLDTNILSKATFYYNFANYSIMACFDICYMFNFSKF